MINEIMGLLHQYPLQAIALVTFLHHAVDAAVDSLPEPDYKSGVGYRFFYTFSQKLAGNYRKKS